MADNSETNVAEILRNIAAESDAVSGKIIRQANKAAAKGKSFVVVEVSREDYECVNFSSSYTPPIERLLSLGFKLSCVNGTHVHHKYFGGTYQLEVSW